jgi:S-methylmethionine-dependent homocysteine/selenocysteine methylase
MATYRKHLPQLDADRIFLSDGGLETSLIYHGGFDLPAFAAFPLMKDESGRDALHDYYRPYAEIAVENRLGFILETPTWRANPDWGAKLGYGEAALADVNRAGVALMQKLRAKFETRSSPMPVSGNIGPRGDGYQPDRLMSVEEAERYHAGQIRVFKDAGADLVTAMTMNYAEEAAGIARAAADADMPVVISITVETDGRLATGQALGDAIDAIDAASGGAPAYYMVNCAHPTHFAAVLDAGGAWVERIAGLRPNASAKSHAELDAATELDDGDPRNLGLRTAELRRRHGRLTIFGGCCGTDHRHIGEICLACSAVH